jgi:hypothetical protein
MMLTRLSVLLPLLRSSVALFSAGNATFAEAFSSPLTTGVED